MVDKEVRATPYAKPDDLDIWVYLGRILLGKLAKFLPHAGC